MESISLDKGNVLRTRGFFIKPLQTSNSQVNIKTLFQQAGSNSLILLYNGVIELFKMLKKLKKKNWRKKIEELITNNSHDFHSIDCHYVHVQNGMLRHSFDCTIESALDHLYISEDFVNKVVCEKFIAPSLQKDISPWM